MRVTSSPAKAQRTQPGAWASRLARCLDKDAHGEPEAQQPAEVLRDVDALFVMFDGALAEANEALAGAGLAEHIHVRDSDSGRHYSLTEDGGEERAISISLSLQGMDGHVNGGAFIGMARTRLAIYVVPDARGEHIHWRTADGGEFTVNTVHDLFLSVFGDDAAATYRLSPLAGSDIFQTPWS